MWVTPEQIKKAKQIDLVSYLQCYEPDNIRKIGNESYCTKEHDSLKISNSNGLWHWFSRHIGGKNALDYLTKVKGFSFTDAVELLCDEPIPMPQKQSKKQNVIKAFELPPLNSDICQVKRYLMHRGIYGKLIDYCEEHGILYEDAKYHNCIFVGRDRDGLPRYGAVRSTVTAFKRELDGSDKQYSFRITMPKETNTVCVFESAIDLLSSITLDILAGRGWPTMDFLSLGGVYVTDDNQRNVPVALQAYLDRNPNIEVIVFHLDSDEIGRKATSQIMDALQGQYELIDCPPRMGKDYNDYLKIERERREISR